MTIKLKSPPLPPGAPGKNGFKYGPKFGIIVVCTDEVHQQQVFAALNAQGYKTKVVTV